MKTFLTHEQINNAANRLGLTLASMMLRKAYPIPRGGVPAAYAVQNHYSMLKIVETPEEADCYIDDLIDSGTTKARYNDKPFFALFNKQVTPEMGWIVFPWENSVESSAEDIGRRLLQFIGEDPSREGLQETPARFLRAWTEWTSGYTVDIPSLFKQFGDGAEGYDQMILVDPIPFYSHCEHHLAPIFGTVHIAYIPDGKIVGLSKLCRLVDAFSKRLQVQERLTVQLANTLNEYLEPLGAGVVVRARHFCMESRGVKKQGSETTTVALRGAFKDGIPRHEFLSLIKGR